MQLVPVYEIPAHCSVAFTTVEVRPSLLILSALNTYSPGGVWRVPGGLRTCFGRWFLIRLTSPEAHPAAWRLPARLCWGASVQGWQHTPHPAGAGVKWHVPLQTLLLSAARCAPGTLQTGLHPWLLPGCVCALLSCHHFFPQNKYLMLLLSLHLIKMYRICAVNSNETNKTRAPSLEGIRCEWKMSLQTKKFCSKQGLRREVSPVMTSIKYTNGTFSTILNMAFSVLYTQSKWFDHRA